MTTLLVDALAAESGSGTVSVIPGTALYAMGHVLQVIQVVKTDTWSAAPGANTFIEVPGYSASITPTSVNSKILVCVDLYLGMSSYNAQIRLMRNFQNAATTLTTTAQPVWLFGGNNGAPVSNRASMTFYSNYYPSASATNICARAGGQVLDSPNTTAPCEYTVQVKDNSTATIYVNRSNTWSNTTDYDGAGSSFLTLMEIAAQ